MNRELEEWLDVAFKEEEVSIENSVIKYNSGLSFEWLGRLFDKLRFKKL